MSSHRTYFYSLCDATLNSKSNINHRVTAALDRHYAESLTVTHLLRAECKTGLSCTGSRSRAGCRASIRSHTVVWFRTEAPDEMATCLLVCCTLLFRHSSRPIECDAADASARMAGWVDKLTDTTCDTYTVRSAIPPPAARHVNDHAMRKVERCCQPHWHAQTWVLPGIFATPWLLLFANTGGSSSRRWAWCHLGSGSPAGWLLTILGPFTYRRSPCWWATRRLGVVWRASL